MNNTLAKNTQVSFLFTAGIYLILLSFIGYPLTTVLKPIPIICLIIGVLRADLLPKRKALLVIALGLSALGDIVLTLPIPLDLELGIGCFLFAHCFYIALFLKAFKYRVAHLFYYLPVLIVMTFFAVILIPFLGSLFIPVMIYSCILMLMVFSAFQVARQGFIIGAGAISFMLSDLILAFNVFVYPQIDAGIFIMFSYYSAQLLLTCGLIGLYKTDSSMIGTGNSWEIYTSKL